MKKTSLLVLLIVFFLARGAFASIVFEQLQLPIFSPTEAAEIGDLNGDGKNDVVITTSYYFNPDHDYKVFVFYQDNNGNLAAPFIYGGGTGESVALGDINHNGRIDIVTVSKFGRAEKPPTTEQEIGVLYQKVDGTFTGIREFGQVKAYSVKVGDVNNDGLSDVVSLSGGDTNSVEVYLQKPDGSLAEPISYQAVHKWFSDLALGDVNNDGLTDVVVMNADNHNGFSDPLPNIGVLYQRQNGTLSSPLYLRIGNWQNANAVAIGDINSDHLNDIVISYGGNQPTSKIGVYLQDPAGGFGDLISYASYDMPSSIAVADVDNDGRADVVTAHSAFNAVGVYRQKPNGTLEMERLYGSLFTGFYPDNLAVGDINSDGLPDIVADGRVLYQRNIECNYSVSPIAVNFGVNGGAGELKLTATDPVCPWNAASNKTWLWVPGIPFGSGNASISISVTANPETSPRSGTIRVAGNIIEVSQPGCEYTLSEASQSFGFTGGAGEIRVSSSGSACRWDVISNNEWIVITSKNNFTGSGTVSFSVSKNPNAAGRTGTIAIAGQTFLINQSGTGCSYSITPLHQEFSQNAASGGINVATSPDCHWSTQTFPSWVSITSGGRGSGNGTISFAVSANTGEPARAGNITIEGNSATVTQSGSNGVWRSLGALPGSLFSYLNGMSADGLAVVGEASFVTDPDYYLSHAFRWTQKTGMVDLGTLPGGTRASALAASADGLAVVGEVVYLIGPNYTQRSHAFLWTQATGMVDLGNLPGGTESAALAISADGGTVAGTATDSSGKPHAFRWKKATGMVDLGTLPGGKRSAALSISADGRIISGLAGKDGYLHAFRWTQKTGMVDLGALPGGSTTYNAFSANGRTVVGGSWVVPTTYHAFRWTRADGMIDLGSFGDNSEAVAVSADGGVVVGWALSWINNTNWPRAFRWTKSGGMQTVKQWLSDNGLDTGTVEFSKGYAVSADGNTIAGTLYNGDLFLAHVSLRSMVKVLSPNGGETIPNGGAATIAWSAPPPAVSFSLSYSLDNGATWQPIIPDKLTASSYKWTVPILLTNSTTCKVRVIAYDAEGHIVGSDQSNRPFSIEIVN